jgi:hypothetical protein
MVDRFEVVDLKFQPMQCSLGAGRIVHLGQICTTYCTVVCSEGRVITVASLTGSQGRLTGGAHRGRTHHSYFRSVHTARCVLGYQLQKARQSFCSGMERSSGLSNPRRLSVQDS